MTVHTFDDTIVAAVLRHMNTDHSDDNLLIAKAFVDRDAEAATMIGLDGGGGTWRVTVDGDERDAVVPWKTTVTERAEIRREVVVLYEAACDRLGVPARGH
ncbi:DUF2470 domain-containing protein [Mycetocola zhadangensis]|uniref:DUF2470 domain-containing protein n=1 Tax=Mycetocola zhadangensis TaxID=1164595 RepID=A0A3L7J1D1_9MICO|nr:DUF2470 domain-containing protein [Mycetocola zhadangensis]RLQ84346.1 DUF2470 domain-containing protein [Mycetocola zhadangensis]